MMRRERLLHVPLALSLLWTCIGAQRIDTVSPKYGSVNGGTRLTIEGDGFAQASQFNLNANDPNFGNSVTLVSRTTSVPCDVERDSSHSNQIMCYTRPLQVDDYEVHVSVDGVAIPSSQICNGNQWNYWCMFYIRLYNTPTIQSITPLSGTAGTVVTLRGRIYTDVYGSNTDLSSNGLNVRFLRAYMGGMPCLLLIPNSDVKYGLVLDSSTSQWGFMSCKMTGTYVGHQNLSYILDSAYGRSLPDFGTFRISAMNKLSMFQTYAEVAGVSPSAGSVLGGTLLTIQGQNFDETDQPALVLVGGHECPITSLSDETIVCVTPAYESNNMTVFPGGRGFKMEMWNNSNPRFLEDVLNYDSSRPGYSLQWVDSLSYAWPTELDYFVARFTGFFVPTQTDNYYFLIKADDRCQLYFSQTGLPQDKTKIAFQPYYTSSFFTYPSQRSAVMRLEQGKAYYIEVLMQEYTVESSVDVAFFKEISPFTAQQATEAVNEVQQIVSSYRILPEKQVVGFTGWAPVTPVSEEQTLSISSHCFALLTCDSTYYLLGYGAQKTGLISVSASDVELQEALNGLWSISPDTVSVTKQSLTSESIYTVTFNSNRGDFEELEYWTLSTDTNITVNESVKGVADLSTFTLMWGGIPSLPLPYNASDTQVLSAINSMVSAKCPSQVPTVENAKVKFFRDYETNATGFSSSTNGRGVPVSDTEAFCGRWSLMNPGIVFNANDTTASGTIYSPIQLQTYSILCLGYRGYLANAVQVLFTYQTAGSIRQQATQISVQFDSADAWNYKCVDLLGSIQTNYVGLNYRLLQLSVYGASASSVYYIDSVHIGQATTALDPDLVIQQRQPPALASLDLFFSNISVLKESSSSQMAYEITLTPFHCGFDVPLFELGFLQETTDNTTDLLTQNQGNATVTIFRPQRASPPLTGTFDVQMFEENIQGLAVDISAADLQYALQGVPQLGLLQVQRSGDCRGHTWTIQWLTMPGSQPLLQINASNVVGVNPSVTSSEVQRGGVFKQRIMGDFLRVPADQPQVQVFINGIPSWCSGDCSFTWTESKTPIVNGISPSTGSSGLGTILNITGSGFDGGLVTVKTGDVNCFVLNVTDTSITCEVGEAGAGTQAVSLSFSALGNARFQSGGSFNFTNLLGVRGMNPSTGSVAGGTVLSVSGFGFSSGTTVLIGNQTCDVTRVEFSRLTCTVPPGAEGVWTVTLTTELMTASSNESFTYNNSMTGLISAISPLNTTLYDNSSITISGSNFEELMDGSSVLVGGAECSILQWTDNNITCLLPKLPPGVYDVNVRVGNQGFAVASVGVDTAIEYVLKLTGFSPSSGSLYGGTTITLTGSGFSPSLAENILKLGKIFNLPTFD